MRTLGVLRAVLFASRVEVRAGGFEFSGGIADAGFVDVEAVVAVRHAFELAAHVNAAIHSISVSVPIVAPD